MASQPLSQAYDPSHSLQNRPRGILRLSQPNQEVTMDGGKGIYVGGTLLSILISLALYMSGRREAGIFVGLWAPTILNLGQSLLDED
jgi:hypothetical protein